MTKELFEDLKAKVDALVAVPHCAPELKEIALKWVDSVGTDVEKETAEAFIAELEEDVMSIQEVIEFFGSDIAKEKFGVQTAEALLSSSKEALSKGAKYCTCEACKAGEAILNLKEFILG